MSNEDLFIALEDIGTQLKLHLEFNKFKSIIDVKVFRRTEKRKKWIFTYSKKSRVIRFTVNEPLFIIESLMDGLDLRRSGVQIHDDVIVEVVDEQGNEVV